jgi:hypothetical protein
MRFGVFGGRRRSREFRDQAIGRGPACFGGLHDSLHLPLAACPRIQVDNQEQVVFHRPLRR